MKEQKDVPFVCPIEGAGIQLEWTKDGKHLEIEFDLNGNIVWLKSGVGGCTVSGECRVDDCDKIKELFAWYEKE